MIIQSSSVYLDHTQWYVRAANVGSPSEQNPWKSWFQGHLYCTPNMLDDHNHSSHELNRCCEGN